MLTIAALVVGCTNANVPLNKDDAPLAARMKNQTRATTFADVSPMSAGGNAPTVSPSSMPSARELHDADGWFVGLAISGGGSRSANFAAGCMFELQRVGLLKRVDYISSVSGGSLPAAYYCLNDDATWNPGNVERAMSYPFASDVIGQILLPWNFLAVALTDWDRSDLLADSFKRRLFTSHGHNETFADLRDDRPRLLINSTDLQSGRPFIFCDESFDEINSDLSKYPIAYAVAASAAVPVVMHQVTLRDYSTVFKQFLHLIDGGINDNLGITSLVETFDAQERTAEKLHRPDPYPNGAVFIVLDARTRFDAHLDDKGDVGLIESLSAGASLTSTALLNRVSSATLSDIIVKYSPDEAKAADLRAAIDELNKEGFLKLQDRRKHEVTVVHLALSRVADLTNTPSQGFFERLNDIATYFNISDEEAASLYKGAKLLVEQKFEDRLEAVNRKMDESHR